MRRRLLAAVGLYLAGCAALGARPYLPGLYHCGHGTDIGAYNMFRAKAELTEAAALLGPGDARIPLDVDRYFWKHHLVSTTHPHVEPSTVAHFVRFLARRRELHALVPAGADPSAWRIAYQLTYRINDGAPVTIAVQRPLASP